MPPSPRELKRNLSRWPATMEEGLFCWVVLAKRSALLCEQMVESSHNSSSRNNGNCLILKRGAIQPLPHRLTIGFGCFIVVPLTQLKELRRHGNGGIDSALKCDLSKPPLFFMVGLGHANICICTLQKENCTFLFPQPL